MKHYKGKHVAKRKGRFWIIAVIVAILAAGSVFAWMAYVKPMQQAQTIALTPEPESEQEERPIVIPPKPVKPTVSTRKTKPDGEAAGEEEIETEVLASHREGVYNILVCGTDYDGSHTDSILIAHMDVNAHTTALMSIPRDTVVENGSGGIRKINAVYANGGENGMKRLQRELEVLLGFPTDGYVLIELEAFQKLVDIMGGVWYDVPVDMHYTDASQELYIDLKAGYQKLDGYNAMCLCRFRKGYPTQDIRRTEVQQDFIKTVAKQCMSLKNLPKLKKFADVFRENVLTDLTVGNMLYFAVELAKCDLDAMICHTVQGEGVMVNKISYYPLFDWSVLQIVNEAFNPYEVPLTAENIRVITPDLALSYQTSPEPEPEEAASEEAVPEGEREPEELPTEPWPESEPTDDDWFYEWNTDSPEPDALWD